ncbi:MAG: SUMF1/EgtB/PvdO family nonheme iron enzyme [Planctomycetes bacterium]|nr:SUMF1/EgtB/PvdO family nonheme iron enzyme [Planctomycetota bacterium]
MFAWVWLSALGAAEPDRQPAASGPARLVFVHYMVCFFNSVEGYKQEIELAQRHGIDGFALNCGQWKGSGYEKAAQRLFQAARELDSGFKLFFSPDLNSLGNLNENIGDMVRQFKDHPNQFRHEGRTVLSGWGGGPESYAGAVQQLESEGLDLCFVPFVYNPKYASIWSLEQAQRMLLGHPHMDGLFHFGADGSVANLLNNNANGRRVTLTLGKLFMAGVAPAYNSANLRDFQGMHGYGAVWEGIIRDAADWVEIVTWNDYVEDSNLMPFRWPGGQEKPYYVRDESFLDVTGYYSAWFKSGVRPPILQDKLYYAYRNRSRWQQRVWSEKDAKWVDIMATAWPYDQIHDDVEDFVYVTTFLTAPAELSIQMGKARFNFTPSAGLSHFKARISAGVPLFSLKRARSTLAEIIGRKEIISEPTPENSPRGYHLAHRTWTGGFALGDALRLEAESGQLHETARILRLGGVTAVSTAEKDGSGFTLPLRGLATATYNIRMTYCNPSTNEARLTLVADGPPRAPGEFPYFVPAFLPPTGNGRFATTSFFWSLYKETSFLKLEWQLGRTWGAKPQPEFDDHGSVLVDAIDLVRVDPLTIPAQRDRLFPEVVEIPGGSFTMGCSPRGGGNPDESPTHRVTLSPFAIGKYEVTNEQYEQFDPGHRQFRDGYSWRDQEPVIYVSWTDAAKYCNWLSEKTGLKKAYDEKTWELDRSADGYRLPTEAEWEHVATGRGEGRRFPWGDQAPSARRGNFLGDAAIAVDPHLRSRESSGTLVVGDCPAGASRDGVMDLAGNVSEWCSDWYHPYTSEAQTDPCALTPSNFRVIRGGSFGYYNFSQRCADREYNNPVYSGYVYLGFRVVLSQTGWDSFRSGPAPHGGMGFRGPDTGP